MRRNRLAEAKKTKQEENRVEDITDAEVEAAPLVAAAAASSAEGEGKKEDEDDGEGKGLVPIYNGAVYANYRWTQSLHDLQV